MLSELISFQIDIDVSHLPDCSLSIVNEFSRIIQLVANVIFFGDKVEFCEGTKIRVFMQTLKERYKEMAILNSVEGINM